MIEVHDLTHRYGQLLALDGLSFRADPGEILGLLGPNGAGKSTTVRILTGMMKPTAGQARVAGFDVLAEPLAVKQRVGYVPESGALYEALTPDEYLSFVALLYHLEDRVATVRANELVQLFDLADVRAKRMVELSKGMKQKVLIAAALIHAPDVLVLDEPLTGLDANAALVVKQLLRGLAAQGRTVLFCSHILDVVERVCSRILILDKGRKVVEGTAPEIVKDAGRATLEEAFVALTETRDAGRVTADVLSTLSRSIRLD
ncbi:MAG: ATP-binding cassette domain-containing protein [Luteitalea sp.]|nr:ATP-binding cassette domain-containing protein [Luteitalea sp.]